MLFAAHIGANVFYAHRQRKWVRMLRNKGMDMPLIDEGLGKIAVQFWNLTWNDEHRYLPYEMRLLLSLTNAVGAGRMRQATRELVKAYIHGLDSAALDDGRIADHDESCKRRKRIMKYTGMSSGM